MTRFPHWLILNILENMNFGDGIEGVLAFFNSILLLSQLNQLVVIATGCNSCGSIYDSSVDSSHGSDTSGMPAFYSNFLRKLEEFVARDEQLAKTLTQGPTSSSLLSGSLSMRSLFGVYVCKDLQMDQNSMFLMYVAIMNAIFSAQRSTVPIDSCYIGSNNSAFLKQASYITGGIYYRPPQLDGLFQYLSVCIWSGSIRWCLSCQSEKKGFRCIRDYEMGNEGHSATLPEHKARLSRV
ncbi:general transcription and DNA repair factor IIH subunit TFB4-like [Senna tora]|uniref:General transcription and DNA repair factor IIH subunit TFB4 n=1 Tax=Senna tora TaxID=362788 RepID=A0A834TYR9_9FABA|nr:general transcription and DNA repair factor IIH subunit TFB4-like [Senna tora]